MQNFLRHYRSAACQPRASRPVQIGKSHAIRGFTLVEVMVAVSIFAVIAVASYASIGSVLNSREVINDKHARMSTLQRVHSLLKNDVRYAVNRSVRDEFGDLQNPMLIGNGEELLTLTALYPAVNQSAKFKRVVWEFKDNALWRNEYPVLDRSPDSQKIERRIADNVADVSIFHYVLVDDAVQRESTWESEDALPLAIEVEIELQDTQVYRWFFAGAQL